MTETEGKLEVSIGELRGVIGGAYAALTDLGVERHVLDREGAQRAGADCRRRVDTDADHRIRGRDRTAATGPDPRALTIAQPGGRA